jgi:hypothetical protein
MAVRVVAAAGAAHHVRGIAHKVKEPLHVRKAIVHFSHVVTAALARQAVRKGNLLAVARRVINLPTRNNRLDGGFRLRLWPGAIKHHRIARQNQQ